MNPDKNPEDKFVISLSDILALFRKSKWKIISYAVLMSLLSISIAAIKPIKYKAEGTFREKSSKGSGFGGALTQMFMMDNFASGSVESEAISMIKSRKLLKEVIKKLKLQGELIAKCDREGLLDRMQKNLKIEWAKLKRSPYHVLPDLACPLTLQSIIYEGEVPLHLSINIDDQGQYKVVEAIQGFLGKGTLNQPFSFDQLSFTLTSNQPILPQEFILTVYPFSNLVTRLTKELEVDNLKTDKGVLKLAYSNRNRHLAGQLINTVMESYQEYLKENRDRLANIQMGYLYKRKNESAYDLKHILLEHADFLATDHSQTGLADSKKEREFLATRQHELREKLLANELEIKRLKNIHPSRFAYYDQVSDKEGNPIIINSLLQKIRDLKQERDGLELALRKNDLGNQVNREQAFDQQFEELKEVQQYKIDLHEIIEQYRLNLPVNNSLSLVKNPRFLVQEWLNRLSLLSAEDNLTKQRAQESFLLYLNNLERLFTAHEKILQERVVHQQNLISEFQGINIKMANDLYMDFCKRLQEEEAVSGRATFLLNQMEDPDFEITSLSSVLLDPVSSTMITKASELVLAIKDQNNQSPKEQERLRHDLNLQRTFLMLHLKQMIQVMDLNKKMLNQKVYALQSIMLELVHQQIMLLEKNLHDYLMSRLENLEQEREIIKQHLKDIQNEIGTSATKWVAEQLIEQQIETNQLIVKEIAKIVESKNLSHNLEVIQSAPIDMAISPIQPASPGIVFYGVLGAAFGSLLGFGLALGKSITKGIEASSHNLKVLGQHVSGFLSARYHPDSKIPLADCDLETLRRLQNYFDASNEGGKELVAKTLLLVQGKGPNYIKDLAQLFIKKGQKVLVMDLDLNQSTSSQPGLLQYLQGEIQSLPISSSDYGDYLAAGGVSRFSIEMLISRNFHDLLNELKPQYDWIIATTHALPQSAEAESLVPLFSYIGVTVYKENLGDLALYTQLSAAKEKKVSFILVT